MFETEADVARSSNRIGRVRGCIRDDDDVRDGDVHDGGDDEEDKEAATREIASATSE